MPQPSLQKVLRWVSQLEEGELDELFTAIEARRSTTKAKRVLETAREALQCPHCGHAHVVRNGLARGLQRFLCRGCRRTFNATTGTALSGLHRKDRLYAFARCMADGLTVRETAEVLRVAVSTAFRMRHRILDAVVQHQPKLLAGLVEVDETFFRESFKGSRRMPRPARLRGGGKRTGRGPSTDLIPVLVAKSRGGPYVADKVLPSMSKGDVLAALSTFVGPDTLLVADGSGTIKKAATDLGVTFEPVTVSAGSRVRGAFHVQTVNEYHGRLKTWINRELRGVATRHLPRYLAWMRIIDWSKRRESPDIYLISGLGKQVINT